MIKVIFFSTMLEDELHEKLVEKDNSNLRVKSYDDDRTIKNLKAENKDLKSKVDVLNKLERTL